MICFVCAVALVAANLLAVDGFGSPAARPADRILHLVQAEKPPKGKRPTNLSKYSEQFWPRNSLRLNQVVTRSTPYGLLRCRSVGQDRPRECSLD
jgi:hypothetical protein